MLKRIIIFLSIFLLPRIAFAGFATNVNTGTTQATSTTLVEHVELSSTHGITSSDWLILYSVGATVDSDGGGLVNVSFMKDDSLITAQAFGVEPENTGTGFSIPHQWWYMNESGDSGDTFQIKVASSGAIDTRCNDGGIVGIDLGNLTKGTDWLIASAENGVADMQLADTWSDFTGVSITIPANNSGERWLILARSASDTAAIGDAMHLRFSIDSEASTVLGENEAKAEDATEFMPGVIMWVYTVPDNDTHTIDLQQVGPEASGTKLENANLIAVNLDALSTVVDFEQSETDETDTSGSFVDYSVASKSVNFTSTGDYLAISYMAIGNSSNNDSGSKGKLLINNTDSYMERYYDGATSSETDRKTHLMFDVFTVGSTGNQDVDSQYSEGSSDTGRVTEGSVVVFLEEAGEAPTASPFKAFINIF